MVAPRPMRRTVLLQCALACGATLGAQDQPQAGHGADDVMSLLETHCVRCHGGEKTKAGLDLATREALLRGGESGAAIVPADPKASLLYRMVAHLEEGFGREHEKTYGHRAGAGPRRTRDSIRSAASAGRSCSQTLTGDHPAAASEMSTTRPLPIRPSVSIPATVTSDGCSAGDRDVLAPIQAHTCPGFF